MDKPASPTLLERFTGIIRGLAGAVSRRGRADSILGPALAVTLLTQIGLRLDRLHRRFASLLGRIEAGTLRPLPAAGQAQPRRQTGAAPSVPRPDHPPRIAEKSGWLVDVGRHHAAHYHDMLVRLLADPDMLALIAAEPRRSGRILRPLCRMLGVRDVPEPLRPTSRSPGKQGDRAVAVRTRRAGISDRPRHPRWTSGAAVVGVFGTRRFTPQLE